MLHRAASTFMLGSASVGASPGKHFTRLGDIVDQWRMETCLRAFAYIMIVGHGSAGTESFIPQSDAWEPY